MRFRIKHLENSGRYTPQVWDGTPSALYGGWRTIIRSLPGYGFSLASGLSAEVLAYESAYESAEEAKRVCEDYAHWKRTGEEPGVSYDYFELDGPEADGEGPLWAERAEDIKKARASVPVRQEAWTAMPKAHSGYEWELVCDTHVVGVYDRWDFHIGGDWEGGVEAFELPYHARPYFVCEVGGQYDLVRNVKRDQTGTRTRIGLISPLPANADIVGTRVRIFWEAPQT